MAENKKVTEASEKATKPGTPKVSFAEQLSIRIKPYMEALTEEGIKSFDEFIRSINLHAFDKINPEVLNSIDDGVYSLFREMDIIIERLDSILDEERFSNRPGTEEKHFEAFDREEENKKKEKKEKKEKEDIQNEIKKEEKKANESEKERKKEAKASKEVLKRTAADVSTIKKKVGESLLSKILKAFLYILGGGWLFVHVGPWIKELIVTEAKALGLDKIGANIRAWMEKNMPEALAKFDEIKGGISKVISWIFKIYHAMEKPLRAILQHFGIDTGGNENDMTHADYWTNALYQKGYYDWNKTPEELAAIEDEVWKESGAWEQDKEAVNAFEGVKSVAPATREMLKRDAEIEQNVSATVAVMPNYVTQNTSTTTSKVEQSEEVWGVAPDTDFSMYKDGSTPGDAYTPPPSTDYGVGPSEPDYGEGSDASPSNYGMVNNTTLVQSVEYNIKGNEFTD